ncbi:Extracellular matrix glycoprotein Laminin subunits alpha and gamma [Phaffia rhodozyma]|uniref:Extracellular matrix glycoprotein Laminin subunits alpha and gamma n=1 Tax=Phaffia rhodozyma TaxID=264483 RepID=A0A0F7SV74_PHARH|nr:Extracellular matrix glycoprotein Laminin subunits alpha and gamma [Phaffia rhodozyma]
MAFASAFTGVLNTPSRYDSSADGADTSLPSLADSFHSDHEREKDRFETDRAQDYGETSNNGQASDWDFREPPGTVKKERTARQDLSSPSSPTLNHISHVYTPGGHAPSSLTDLPTPQPSTARLAAPGQYLALVRSTSDSSSTSSSFAIPPADDESRSGYSDDLFTQSPIGSPEKLGEEFPTRPVTGGIPRGQQQTRLGSKNSLTLKEQEKALDLKERENFDLKLKVHFLTERLKQQSPETLDNIHQENLQLKVAYARLKIECKKNKKYVLDLVDALEELKRENDDLRAGVTQDGANRGGRDREKESELNDLVRDEREKRIQLEDDLQSERERNEDLDRQFRDLDTRSKAEIDELKDTVSTLESETDALASQLEQTQTVLEDTEDKLGKAQEDLELKEQQLEDEQARLAGLDGMDEEQLDRIKGRTEELEDMVQKLETQLDTHQATIATLEDEREDLLDQRDELTRQIEVLESGQRDLSADRANALDHLDSERNELRDKLAASTLELERKQLELDQKEKALQDAFEELDTNDRQWADEVKEGKALNDELREVLQEREKEAEQLRDALHDTENELSELQERLTELENLNEEIGEKLEEQLRRVELEKVEREAESVANNEEIQALGERIHELEDELEAKAAKEAELEAELNALDAALEEAQVVKDEVVGTLKEKLAETKADLDEIAELYDASQADLALKQTQVTDLSTLAADLEDRQVADEQARKKLLDERTELTKRVKEVEKENGLTLSLSKRELKDREAHWDRLFQEKEDSVRRLSNELDQVRDRLSHRETDLHTIQDNARLVGHTHDTDRFAMELEIERLKKDLVRVESDWERVKKELKKKELTLGMREDALADLNAKSRELENKLSSELQSRLNMADKLDTVQKSSRVAENEAAVLRERVNDLEHRLTSEHRSLTVSKNQTESQKQEHSQLLLVVYQHLNKILGTEDRGGPSANFAVFKDAILTRLRTLSHIQSHFEKKVRGCESVFNEKLISMKKQLDHKWKQLDHFESSVRKVELVKTQWRNRYAQKQGELESLQARYAELSSQLTASKEHTRTSSTNDAKTLETRISTLERRLAHAKNQISVYEEKLSSARNKMTLAESKWDARVREYENRLKAAEEKVKSEKQGGKERAAQLESQVRNLEKQIDNAKRRNERIQDVLPSAHIPTTSTASSGRMSGSGSYNSIGGNSPRRIGSPRRVL